MHKPLLSLTILLFSGAVAVAQPMLGLGHAPAQVLEAISEPHVMANVMTPSLSQFRLTERLDTQFTAAVNNIANHPNFNRPLADISAPATVGTINGVRQYGNHRAIELRLQLEF